MKTEKDTPNPIQPTDSQNLDEETRARLFEKAVASIPRWISPNDPLPEIPDWLKPKVT